MFIGVLGFIPIMVLRNLAASNLIGTIKTAEQARGLDILANVLVFIAIMGLGLAISPSRKVPGDKPEAAAAFADGQASDATEDSE